MCDSVEFILLDKPTLNMEISFLNHPNVTNTTKYSSFSDWPLRLADICCPPVLNMRKDIDRYNGMSWCYLSMLLYIHRQVANWRQNMKNEEQEEIALSMRHEGVSHLWLILMPKHQISFRWTVFYPSGRYPETCRINAKVHRSCSGSSWWPNTLLRNFILGFPLICCPSVLSLQLHWP